MAEDNMVKALIIFVLFILGGFLIAIALFGATGVWDKLLFISLEGLQHSWEWVVGLIAVGVACWFFGGILMRVK